MGERSGHAPGTFCWTDLTTPEQAGAKEFYTGLFGWEGEDMPMADGAVYSIMRLRGRDVAAIAPQPQQQRDAGVPPVWNSYIRVESADACVERAAELGASVHAPAFDVLQAGRMGVIQDPQGAYFLPWEPRNHQGAGLVNEPGALIWNELASPDIDASAGFYHDLFGWSTSPSEGGGPPYLMIENAGSQNGGITLLQPPGTPPHWLVYFGVDDIDASLARVGELGGSTIAGPIDIQRAKIAVVSDSQGAVLAFYDGHFDP